VSYEIFVSFMLAVSDSWAVSYATPSAQISWGDVVIVLFPFLVPASPRVIIAASIASAATVPLALALRFQMSGGRGPM
jgi:hypothetical protein